MTAGPPPLHALVTDAEYGRPELVAALEDLLDAGGGDVAVHLRVRGVGGRRLHELAVRVREAADRHGGWCVVNDRVDVALTAGADAVQIGGHGLPVADARHVLGGEVPVGRSVHGVGEARRAVRDGANHLVLGTIYPTPTHPERPGAGPGLVEEVARLGPPVIAVGGVEADRLPELRRAGAAGFAARRAVWETGADPAEAARELLRAWRDAE